MDTIITRMRVYFKGMRRSGQHPKLVAMVQWGWHKLKHLNHARHAPSILRSIKSRDCDDLAKIVDLVFDEFGGAMRPLQNRQELVLFLREVQRRQPRCIVEIGTATGGTLFLLTRAAAPDATIVSVDLPGGLYGGGYPLWKGKLFRWFARPGQTMHLIRRNSQDRSTVEMVQAILGQHKADLLFIDGDHSYDGVTADFLLYRSLVRPGGMIGFHDILKNKSDPDIDVERLWSELKGRYETHEIVDNPRQGVYGIGLLTVPDAWDQMSRATPKAHQWEIVGPPLKG